MSGSGANTSPLGEDFSLKMFMYVCKENEFEIIKGHISKYHVHLPISVPPHLSISKLVQYLKDKNSYKMLQENLGLSKIFWCRHLWARGYFVAASGFVTDEMIMEYIENQDDATKHNGSFTVTG